MPAFSLKKMRQGGSAAILSSSCDGRREPPNRFRETVLLAAAHFRDGSHKVSAYILGLNPNTFWYSSIMMPLAISANSSATITLS